MNNIQNLAVRKQNVLMRSTIRSMKRFSAFLDKTEDEFPWDMSYIGEVAECIEETLLRMGQRVHRPVIVTGKDGISCIEEYQYPHKTEIKTEPPNAH